jgi:hypothetical protein
MAAIRRGIGDFFRVVVGMAERDGRTDSRGGKKGDR